jgi:hypothetical protein
VGSVTAAPNPANPGQVVQFASAATGAEPLTYAWNFGDGGTATGATPAHVFTTPGTYTVSVLVTDLLGQSTASTVQVLVAVGANPGNGSIDSDGDGISDEIADGTDPLDPNSGIKNPLNVTKISGKMSFKVSGKDSTAFGGTLDLPASFVPLGQTVVVDVGGAAVTFTLDAKGRSKVERNSFALSMKFLRDKATKQKNFVGGSTKFQVKLSGGSWADDWADEGVDPAAEAKKAPMSIAAQIRIHGRVYESVLPVLYTAKPGVGGNFKKTK